MEQHDAAETQQQFLSVDFVTGLALDECVARLCDCNGDSGGGLTVNEDGSFALHCLFGDNGSEVRFWGTLEAVERGTWVWGTIFEDRATGVRLQPWIPAFLAAGTSYLAFEALVRGAFESALEWVGVLIVMGAIASVRWYRRYRHGLRVVAWVYETLYVPPPPPRPPDSAPLAGE